MGLEQGLTVRFQNQLLNFQVLCYCSLEFKLGGNAYRIKVMVYVSKKAKSDQIL